MNIAVRYFTLSGNTKKLADAIAAQVGAAAESIDSGLTERADILFLGSSLYKFGMEPKVREFVESNADKIGTVVLFGTSASGGSTLKQMSELAAKCGIRLHEKAFTCLGHFLFMHKDRPNASDEEAAAEFAKEVCEGLSNS